MINELKNIDFDESSPRELLFASINLKKSGISVSVGTSNNLLKISVLSSTTSSLTADFLKLFFATKGFSAEIYEAPYNSIVNEILDETSGLYEFKPDYLIIIPYFNDISDFPGLFSEEEGIREWLANKCALYAELINKLKNRLKTGIIFSQFVIPNIRQLGNLESKYLFSRINLYRQLNLLLAQKLPHDITILDLDFPASNIGKDNWFDEVGYLTSKFGYSLAATKEIASLTGKIILSSKGCSGKCLVLDLDNTLWGGIIGDDGIDGINLDPNNPLGEAFISFQRYVKSLKERGVILAVCSKNDEETAKSPFLNHSSMILKADDIACFMCNWDDKPVNIRRIAETLNIGLDSLVFFDDNPAERDIIKRFLPEVKVINVPEDPALFIRALDKSSAFEWLQLSSEDINRSESYINESKMKESMQVFIDYDSYLKSLNMTAKIGLVTEREIPRFAQLINKTNQFNFRTRRYSEAEIHSMAEQTDKYSLLYVLLNDKFISYGIISAVILEKRAKDLFIDTWVMSCRAFKRGVEYAVWNKIIDTARQLGINTITGEYIPSAKNNIIAGLFSELDFSSVKAVEINNSAQITSIYQIKLDEAKFILHNIELVN